MNFIKAGKKFIEKGHSRTVKAKKNVLLAIIARGLGILIGFAYFPISLAYLSPEKFGLFLTLASILDWFREFDVGIGNGLKNKFGEAIADEDDELARGYVSTAYFFLGSLVIGIALIFMTANFFIPWNDWLQTNEVGNAEIRLLMMFLIAAFTIRFISKLVYQIFYAFQQSATVDFFNLAGRVLFLIMIIILFYTTKESLILYGAAKSFTFAIVPLIVGIFFFYRSQRFRPSYKYVQKSLLGSLFSLGLMFFIIKISMIIIYQTNNFLVARFIGVESVTTYQAAYKYLSIFLTLFSILTAQLWAANIEAYRKGDMQWMKNSLNGVFKIWITTLFIAVFMVLVSPYAYELWLQGKVQIPIMLSIIVALSICMTTWVNMFNLVLNGTGKIRLQMYTWIFACLINIPASIFFAKTMNLGLVGIELGTMISLIIQAIFSPIQARKILRGTDRGIWSQ